jgi:hypothetical protein
VLAFLQGNIFLKNLKQGKHVVGCFASRPVYFISIEQIRLVSQTLLTKKEEAESKTICITRFLSFSSFTLEDMLLILEHIKSRVNLKVPTIQHSP